MKKIYIIIPLLLFLIISNSHLIKSAQNPANREATIDYYDVVVIGGEPEGVAAAVSAARNGAKTLLIEKREALGGLMTFGMLNFIDMVYGINQKPAIGGIFKEWHKLVGEDDAFSIEHGKDAFHNLIQKEENLTLFLNSDVVSPILSNDQTTVTGLVVKNRETYEIYAKRFIDATQDADFAVMAGVPFFLGGEDIHLDDRKMAATLMIHLTGVDWEGVKRAVQSQRFGKAWITDSVSWGFNDLHYEYKPVEDNTRLRGLNLVRVHHGNGDEEFYINALQIFGVDGLDPHSIEVGLEKGKRETKHVLTFLQKEFPGFENAEIATYPEELYIRETRHIQSEYMLPMSDIWTNADHWDSIAYGGYPVDIQATSPNDYGYVICSPIQYAIPFRSIVPLKIDNLIIVSRSAGYSSIAAGSARIIPTGMAVGEAGGVAAQLSIENKVNYRELSKDASLIVTLRQRLKDQGAKVEPFKLSYPYEGEWYDESIQYLMNLGLIVGGYHNDLQVEKELNRLHFTNLLINGIQRNGLRSEELTAKLLSPFDNDTFNKGYFTRDEIAAYIIEVFSDASVSERTWGQALEFHLINEMVFNKINEDRVLTRKEGYYIAAHLLKQLSQNR
ncbi:hypothetical protein BKP37_11050 [Anaerobacillus alkalilacustris]|uniref:Glucose-inhibited division protein A n=1 Tax=Anaerobacillus alkalilacustris TaxID=393763 RepID=A0A1S2LKJ0_9BACI|nr:FAD-dependent oxidoreductase [Anaerobacillus alkalilacustris]OIJ13048.1 hypothetical protein BKP37_11050 [Anaerobacillus alkalilacustris]